MSNNYRSLPLESSPGDTEESGKQGGNGQGGDANRARQKGGNVLTETGI